MGSLAQFIRYSSDILACDCKLQRAYYGPWTAFRTLDYGYTRMKVHNKTHLLLEQVSIDKVRQKGTG